MCILILRWLYSKVEATFYLLFSQKSFACANAGRQRENSFCVFDYSDSGGSLHYIVPADIWRHLVLENS